MKRIFACISLLLMLALLPVHAQTPGRAAWVTVGGAPVYTDPHDNAQKAGHIWYGQLVTELERQGDWCRIVSFTTTGIRIEGWVYAPNISMGAVPAYRRMAVVNNPDPQDRLHLRERPNTSAPSLGKYYTGVHVEVLSRQNGWAKVRIGNLNGYMMDEHLRPPDAGANPIGAMPIFEVQNPNRAQNLHLRQHPSLEARSLGLYNNDTRVIQMGFSGDWSHVITLGDGRMGFMLTKYLSPVR